MSNVIWSAVIVIGLFLTCVGIYIAGEHSKELTRMALAADWDGTSPKEEFGTYEDIKSDAYPEIQVRLAAFDADPLNSWIEPGELDSCTPVFDRAWDALVDSGALTGVGADIDWDREMLINA